jgi:hypothetical protein
MIVSDLLAPPLAIAPNSCSAQTCVTSANSTACRAHSPTLFGGTATATDQLGEAEGLGLGPDSSAAMTDASHRIIGVQFWRRAYSQQADGARHAKPCHNGANLASKRLVEGLQVTPQGPVSLAVWDYMTALAVPRQQHATKKLLLWARCLCSVLA